MINLIIVSLPLLFQDREIGYLSDLRLQLFSILLTLWVGCDLSVAPKGIAHYRSTGFHVDELSWFPYASGLLILGGIWVNLVDFAQHSHPSADLTTTLLGTAICLCGILLRYLAIRTLGVFFTTHLQVLSCQPLIRSGLFRWIRHPSYSGLLLIMMGFSLLLDSNWGLLYFCAILLPMVIFRIHTEEKAMLQGFGRPYQQYRQQTKKLIPLFF